MTIIRTTCLMLAVIASFSTYAEKTQQGFEAYVQTLKQEAKEKGISQKTIEAAFKNVKFHPRAVKADNNQPEKKLTLDEYIPRAVPKWKVAQAKKLYKKHQEALQRIGKKYGVQPRFIVALWGVESNFGTYMGNYNVISALSTLAYDGRREELFRKQTMAALTILEEGHISIDKMKGSWAGAMGQCQFMPTSFLNYAQDGNGDGKKDIWTTEEDVFASAANYLKSEGWDGEYTWGRKVLLPEGLDPSLIGREKEKGQYLQQWTELGVKNIHGNPLPNLEKDIKGWIILPDEGGPAYMVYNNYNVLMHWNRSYYFATAVSKLADEIIQ